MPGGTLGGFAGHALGGFAGHATDSGRRIDIDPGKRAVDALHETGENVAGSILPDCFRRCGAYHILHALYPPNPTTHLQSQILADSFNVISRSGREVLVHRELGC